MQWVSVQRSASRDWHWHPALRVVDAEDTRDVEWHVTRQNELAAFWIEMNKVNGRSRRAWLAFKSRNIAVAALGVAVKHGDRVRTLRANLPFIFVSGTQINAECELRTPPMGGLELRFCYYNVETARATAQRLAAASAVSVAAAAHASALAATEVEAAGAAATGAVRVADAAAKACGANLRHMLGHSEQGILQFGADDGDGGESMDAVVANMLNAEHLDEDDIAALRVGRVVALALDVVSRRDPCNHCDIYLDAALRDGDGIFTRFDAALRRSRAFAENSDNRQPLHTPMDKNVIRIVRCTSLKAYSQPPPCGTRGGSYAEVLGCRDVRHACRLPVDVDGGSPQMRYSTIELRRTPPPSPNRVAGFDALAAAAQT